MIYKTTQQQLVESKRKTEELKLALMRKEADLQYLAMMCDVELETEVADEQI